MAQNLTKDIFSFAKNRSEVNFSQDRPLLDFELDELQKILSTQIGKNWLNTRGQGPIADAFLVEPGPNPNEIIVRSGLFTLPNGFVVLKAFDESVTTLTTNTTASPRTDYVVLMWAVSEENSAESPELLDTTLTWPGGETATRDKVRLSIMVSEGDIPEAPPAGVNYFLLATLTRPPSEPFVLTDHISDERLKWARTHVRSGIKVKKDPILPLQANWESGSTIISASPYTIPAGNTTISGGAVVYLYVNATGVLQVALSLPYWQHIPIAKIETDLTEITAIYDLRPFAPSAGGGGGGASQTVVEYQTIDSLNEGDAVYFAINNQVGLADRDVALKTPAIGVSLGPVPAGSTAQILVQGELQHTSWAWTPGQIVYLASSGSLTQTPYTTDVANEGKVNQRVGIAIDTDKVLFNFDTDRVIIGQEANSVSYGEKIYFYGNPVAGDIFYITRVDDTNDSGDLRFYLEGEADGSEKLSIWSGDEAVGGTAMRHELLSDGSAIHTKDLTLGSNNSDVFRTKNLFVEIDTRTRELTYDVNDRISTLVEKDGSTTLRTVTYTYTGLSTNASSAVEVVDGKTITYTYAYDGSGRLTSTSKTVV